MRLIHRKGFAVVYWVVAFPATVLAIIAGARSGAGAAPEFSDGSGTSVGSQILFGLGGAVLGGLLVAAIFAGVWIGLWALDRRANPEFDDRGDVRAARAYQPAKRAYLPAEVDALDVGEPVVTVCACGTLIIRMSHWSDSYCSGGASTASPKSAPSNSRSELIREVRR